MAAERDLHVLHVFPTFDAGGPQVRTARVLAALPATWRHDVVALDDRTLAAALLPANARMLPPPPRAGSLPTIARLRALCARVQPDVVATYNWGAIDGAVAARLTGRPLVHHEETVADDEVGAAARRRDLFRRVVLRSTAALVVPSRALQQKATQHWRLPPARVHRIANGVEVASRLPRDGRPELRRHLGLRADDFVLGFLGNLRPEKGLDTLIQAIALQPDARAHVLVVGDGPERAATAALAARLGIAARVHFVGHRPRPHDHLRAMDVLVLPSRREQMPLALLEAMAHGLPVVATEVGEVRTMLPAVQRPWLVPVAAGAAAIAERCAGLHRSPQLRATLGLANRAHVAVHWAASTMVAAYRAIYSTAARPRPLATAGGSA